MLWFAPDKVIKGSPFLMLSTFKATKPFLLPITAFAGKKKNYSLFDTAGKLKVRPHDLRPGFSLGHSVKSAAVCHPGKCSCGMRLPNEAWRPQVMGTGAAIRPWNYGQTGRQIQQVRSDSRCIHRVKGQERKSCIET